MAIKYIKKHKINDETEINRIRREIKIMTKLNHPNIINVREGEVISLGVRNHYNYDFTAPPPPLLKNNFESSKHDLEMVMLSVISIVNEPY